ncbi:MAG: asparaginase [Clostridiaceae bacterium]|nr:asparaginase [Clostridiaceae bacterium]
MPQLVIRTRSGRVESIHHGYICVTDSDGKIVYSIGNPQARIFLRSSGKPIIANALVKSGAIEKFNLSLKELAIIASSHEGEAYHRRVIKSIIKKIGASEKDLGCGHKYPENQDVQKALIMLGMRPTPIFSNCSGKHVGVLALCKYYGYPVEGYTNPGHPVQQLIRNTIADILELSTEDILIGTDGCTMPTYNLSLYQVSYLYSLLAHGQEHKGKYNDSFETIKKAMITHPKVIRGKGTFCTDLLNYSKGKAIGKIGAEGIYCIAIPEKKLGVCIKIFDGHPWSSYPVVVQVLHELDILDDEVVKKLDKWAIPAVKDDKGNDVGYLHTAFSLINGETGSFELGDTYPKEGTRI